MAAKAYRDAKRLARDRYLPRRARARRSRTPSSAELLRGNIIGVGIGRKLVRGRSTKTRCVRVYVQHKLHRHLVPAKWKVREEIDGVPTDVIELGRFRASAAASPHRAFARPFSMGISIGHDRIMAGTAGAILRVGGADDGRRFVLSNNHVLADSNRLAAGAPIYEPGKLDWGGLPPDVDPRAPVAHLSKFIRLKTSEDNAVDCAVAELDPASVAVRKILEIGKGPAKEPRAAAERMKVRKSGRTTELTRGVVFDVDFDVEVDYPRLGPILFEDQILILPADPDVPFSGSGDSGALVVTDDDEASPVGLLFASADKGSVASHVGRILDRLDVDGDPLEFA